MSFFKHVIYSFVTYTSWEYYDIQTWHLFVITFMVGSFGSFPKGSRYLYQENCLEMPELSY